MQYIHVRNLEKYNPGYTDRNLIWCKIYFTMLNTNYEFNLIDDIDKWRLIALIMLEIQRKKPVPNDLDWLRKKITNNKRSISFSLKALHNFIEYVTDDEESFSSEGLGFIYFVQVEKSQLIKIGFSKYPGQRIKNLERLNLSVKYLYMHEGTIQLENSYHSKFAHLSIAPEWYKPDKCLFDFIEELRTQHSEPLNVTELLSNPYNSVTQSRVDKSRVDKIRVDKDKIGKDKHLEYVYLTKDEHKRLLDKNGDGITNEYIERLNDYLGSTGKRYRSHYHTILNWLRKDGVNLSKPEILKKYGK